MDTELLKQVDNLLDDEDSQILLAFKVSKNQASWTVAGRRGRLQSKPRVLAVSAKRNLQTQKFSVKIHVLKTSPQGLERSKSYKLSSLTSIEAEKSDSTGRSFYLIFDLKKDNTVPQWGVRSIDDRNQLLVCLLKMSRENLGVMPKVVGIDVVEMALWAQKNAKPLAIGAPSAASQTEDGRSVSAVEDSMQVTQQDFVSKAEEEDMEALLGSYVIGIDEAEAFSERLRRELAALEAANVHAILENEGLVEDVLERLDKAAEVVVDMDAWLNVFNVKLRHMRDDIEMIEARNYRLDVQAHNNEGLLRELNTLLEYMHVSQELASILTGGPFDEPNMPEILEACDWLCETLENLEPSQVGEENFSDMRAVREKRAELERLKQTFCRRASDFLRHYLSTQAENLIGDRRISSKLFDHRDLRRRCRIYVRLVQQLKVLDVEGIEVVRKAYCQSVNLVLRRESRDFCSELKTGPRGAPSPPTVDGSVASDCYGRLLGTALPAVQDQALFFAGFLCFDALPPIGEEGPPQEYLELLPTTVDGNFPAPGDQDPAEYELLLSHLSNLFEGLQEDFFSMIDWVYKIDPIRCIPILGTTHYWLEVYATDQGFVKKLLQDAEERITKLFAKYVEEVKSQIEKHDRGVKQTGVLSFIPRFAALATKMESLVESASRDMVDQSYKRLVTVMFLVLDKIAQVDPKSRDVLLLENYAAFQNSTYDLASSVPTLRTFYQQASEAYDGACSRYIESVIIGQFEALFAYQLKINNLLQTVDADEIPFQVGFSKVDFRKMVKSQMATPDKSLQAMYQKMKKSLTSEDLLPSLWDKCQQDFLAKYADMEALIAKCYNNEEMSPSTEEMKELFETVSLIE